MRMKVGVVGNRDGIPRDTVIKILSEVIKPGDVIISGGARGVDAFAKEFARGRDLDLVEFLPEQPRREYYFKRNREIALRSDILIAFVRRGKYKSGTWNTISQFLRLPNKKGQFILYDEKGREWEESEYPEWLLNRMFTLNRKW